LKELNKKQLVYVDLMEGTEGDKKAGNEIIPAKDLKPNFTAGKVERDNERGQKEGKDGRGSNSRRRRRDLLSFSLLVVCE
jgi:hypothetical protein